MLIDCERCKFDLELIVDEIDAGLYSLMDFSVMAPKFLALHPYKIDRLDPNWNVFDRWDEQTKLIHYTNLNKQPWKYPNHPYGEIWFDYFNQARESGFITENDLRLSMIRAYVRRDLLDGNFARPTSPSLTRQLAAPVRRALRGVATKIKPQAK
jgi:hypothetical protein